MAKNSTALSLNGIPSGKRAKIVAAIRYAHASIIERIESELVEGESYTDSEIVNLVIERIIRDALLAYEHEENRRSLPIVIDNPIK